MMNNPQENQQAQHYQNHWWEVELARKEQRIAELEARNKELVCAMREWYEDGFNRGDCGELIVKHGGEA